MRLEDVKTGAWVRTSNGDVGHVAGFDGPCVRVRFDGSELLGWWGASCLEPWVPRVGERVRRTAEARAHSGPCRSDDGFRVARVFPTEVQSDEGWCLGSRWLEPCAPPEAKPETRPADAYLDMLTAETRKACERIGPHLAAVLSEAAEESGQAPKPRDHNATCSRCGGRAYQGIGLAKCVEPVCDDPETREPDSVVHVVDTRRRWGFDANGHEDHGCYVERVYEATGRDVAVRHPTREGAIQAWREAVRRG